MLDKGGREREISTYDHLPSLAYYIGCEGFNPALNQPARGILS